VALASHGLIDPETPSTCYPAPKFREALPGETRDDPVVVSGNLVTSHGPATALQFALQLGQELYGVEKRDQIAKEMLFD
jgi:putative intracellular protease/amidase